MMELQGRVEQQELEETNLWVLVTNPCYPEQAKWWKNINFMAISPRLLVIFLAADGETSSDFKQYGTDFAQ